jgi:hypothetical protein
MGYSRKITQTHIRLLTLLAQGRYKGECKYSTFRANHSPWKHETYFDSQITWMVRQGLIVLTNNRTIQITPAGLAAIKGGG